MRSYDLSTADRRTRGALRLHLNENTAGCSPAVLAALRTIERDDIALYPDYGPIIEACRSGGSAWRPAGCSSPTGSTKASTPSAQAARTRPPDAASRSRHRRAGVRDVRGVRGSGRPRRRRGFRRSRTSRFPLATAARARSRRRHASDLPDRSEQPDRVWPFRPAPSSAIADAAPHAHRAASTKPTPTSAAAR